jgi:hypothetical protein
MNTFINITNFIRSPQFKPFFNISKFLYRLEDDVILGIHGYSFISSETNICTELLDVNLCTDIIELALIGTTKIWWNLYLHVMHEKCVNSFYFYEKYWNHEEYKKYDQNFFFKNVEEWLSICHQQQNWKFFNELYYKYVVPKTKTKKYHKSLLYEFQNSNDLNEKFRPITKTVPYFLRKKIRRDVDFNKREHRQYSWQFSKCGRYFNKKKYQKQKSQDKLLSQGVKLSKKYYAKNMSSSGSIEIVSCLDE